MAKKRSAKPIGIVQETVIVAKCIGCGKRKEVRVGEVAADDVPFCDGCGSVCIAEKAETRAKR